MTHKTRRQKPEHFFACKQLCLLVEYCGKQKFYIYSPIHRNGDHSEDAAANGQHRDVGRDLAVDKAEGPVTRQHVIKVERDV